MPSSDLSHWLLLAQRLFHDLVALLCVPSTRFGHLFPPAGSPAFLWPSYSHLSRVPNLMGRDTLYTFSHRRIPPRSDSPYEPVSVFGYRENTPFSFPQHSGHGLETFHNHSHRYAKLA